MREIKFRAWHPLNKEMVYPYIGQNFGYGAYTNADILKGFSPENIMQFSGLPDRDKKEIYEGDIVQLRYWHNNPPSKRPKQKFITVQLPVIFENGEFKPDDQETRSTEYGTTYGNWWEHCAVIGNIFENHDLIKKQ